MKTESEIYPVIELVCSACPATLPGRIRKDPEGPHRHGQAAAWHARKALPTGDEASR